MCDNISGWELSHLSEGREGENMSKKEKERLFQETVENLKKMDHSSLLMVKRDTETLLRYQELIREEEKPTTPAA